LRRLHVRSDGPRHDHRHRSGFLERCKPGASVTATNSQTTSKYEAVSSETGNYTLTVELPGFKKYIRHGVTVLSSTTVRIEVSLEVGGAAEEVTGSAELITAITGLNVSR